jgi:hypothetical protein
MDSNLAQYPLSAQGAVRNWLACGLVTSPLQDLERVIRPDGSPFSKGGRWILNYWAFEPASAALKLRLYRQLPRLDWQPGARPTLNANGVSGKIWEYAAAEEDNIIDFSRFNFRPTLMQGWLFACLEASEPITVQAELLTIGPARLWLNGTLRIHFAQHFSYVALQTVPITLSLSAGLNDLYLHGEMLGWREARLALGLRFRDHPPLAVHLPLGDIPAEQWHRAENGLSHLLIKQFAFPKLPGYVWPDPNVSESIPVEAQVTIPIPENISTEVDSLVLPIGRSLLAHLPAEIPLKSEVVEAMAGLPGENTLSLTLRPVDGTPLVVHHDIWASANAFSLQPYGDYESRRREALEHLARMPYDVPAAMAALAIGTATHIASEAVRLACDFLNNRYDCADFYAVGLLALLFRYGDHPALRAADREHIENAFRNFKFWLDEPGLDAMCYFTENHQILFHVTAYGRAALAAVDIQQQRLQRRAAARPFTSAHCVVDSATLAGQLLGVGLERLSDSGCLRYAGTGRIRREFTTARDGNRPAPQNFLPHRLPVVSGNAWQHTRTLLRDRPEVSPCRKYLQLAAHRLGHGHPQWRNTGDRFAGAGFALSRTGGYPAHRNGLAGGAGHSCALTRCLPSSI